MCTKSDEAGRNLYKEEIKLFSIPEAIIFGYRKRSGMGKRINSMRIRIQIYANETYHMARALWDNVMLCSYPLRTGSSIYLYSELPKSSIHHKQADLIRNSTTLHHLLTSEKESWVWDASQEKMRIQKEIDDCRIWTYAPEGSRFLVCRVNHSAYRTVRLPAFSRLSLGGGGKGLPNRLYHVNVAPVWLLELLGLGGRLNNFGGGGWISGTLMRGGRRFVWCGLVGWRGVEDERGTLSEGDMGHLLRYWYVWLGYTGERNWAELVNA